MWFGPFSFGRGTRGSGQLVSQERAVGDFHGVRLKGIGTIHVGQGPRCSVRVEADDNVVDRLVTAVEDGLLVVDVRGGTLRAVTVDVHVTSPRLDALWLSGQGAIVGVGAIAARDLLCRITGSGKIEVSGSALDHRVELPGMGSVACFGLASARCRVNLSGMGSCEVSPSESLDAEVSGVGHVLFRGHPATVRESVSGMGRVVHAQ